jgi:hypothetical protein
MKSMESPYFKDTTKTDDDDAFSLIFQPAFVWRQPLLHEWIKPVKAWNIPIRVASKNIHMTETVVL